MYVSICIFVELCICVVVYLWIREIARLCSCIVAESCIRAVATV